MHLTCLYVGLETRQAEVLVHNGTNHVKIPGQEELIPLFEYSWLVTVFDVEGMWYRLEDLTADCEGRGAHKEAKRAKLLSELEKREADLKARESRLQEAELDLEQRKKAFEEDVALSKRRDEEPAQPQALKQETTSSPVATESSPQVDPVVGRPPGSPGLSVNVSLPRRVNSGNGTSTSTFITARRKMDTVGGSGLEGPSRPYSPTGSTPTSTPSTPTSPPRALIGASRAAYRQSAAMPPSSEGSTPTESSPIASALSSVYLPEPRLSSSLPSRSPLAAMSAPQLAEPSPTPAVISFGSPTSPRRVSSLPPSEIMSRVSSLPSSTPSSPRSSEYGLELDLSAQSFTYPPIAFELPLEAIWNKEQCDEWLSSKNYPSTNLNDKTSSGQKAVHCAALEGQIEVVEFLVSRGGAEVSQKDLLGNTPLICAASKGRIDTAKWLLAHGAVVEHKAPSGRSALHSAAAGGHVAMCELLIQLGANPLEKEQFGKTPRALAEAYNHRSVSEFLKNCEANFERQPIINGSHESVEWRPISSTLAFPPNPQLQAEHGPPCASQGALLV